MNVLTRSTHNGQRHVGSKAATADQRCNYKGTARRAPFLQRLNTGTLALLMFVALAFLPATHGKDAKALFGRGGSNDGYLRVYSATDEFDDGGTSYYAHSSYVVYTDQGKRLKTVENHISQSDETPDLVALPAGTYVVEARSETRGYVRLRVVVRPGRVTVLDLESEQGPAQAMNSTAYLAYSVLSPKLRRGETDFAVLVMQAMIPILGKE